MCKRPRKEDGGARPVDCVALPRQIDGPLVEMPWVGFGTYKLSDPKNAVLTALRLGYRCLDTAFIYGGEKTEPEVGKAICNAISEGVVARTDLFVITKQWRKFHGEELTARRGMAPTASCMPRSIECPSWINCSLPRPVRLPTAFFSHVHIVACAAGTSTFLLPACKSTISISTSSTGPAPPGRR